MVRITIRRDSSRRGRSRDMCRSVALDLKSADGVETALQLIETALVRRFRPGVMEHIGLGPDEALARNPALVYGRMTGWGQETHYRELGRDLNYIAFRCLRRDGATGFAPAPR